MKGLPFQDEIIGDGKLDAVFWGNRNAISGKQILLNRKPGIADIVERLGYNDLARLPSRIQTLAWQDSRPVSCGAFSQENYFTARKTPGQCQCTRHPADYKTPPGYS